MYTYYTTFKLLYENFTIYNGFSKDHHCGLPFVSHTSPLPNKARTQPSIPTDLHQAELPPVYIHSTPVPYLHGTTCQPASLLPRTSPHLRRSWPTTICTPNLLNSSMLLTVYIIFAQRWQSHRVANLLYSTGLYSDSDSCQLNRKCPNRKSSTGKKSRSSWLGHVGCIRDPRLYCGCSSSSQAQQRCAPTKVRTPPLQQNSWVLAYSICVSLAWRFGLLLGS